MRLRLLLVFAICSAFIRPAAAEAPWETYHDKVSGIFIKHPAGWTVDRHGYTIVVRSPDRAALALVQAFHHDAGATAATYVAQFAGSQTAFFPSASVQDVQPQQSQVGDEVLATLRYGKDGVARVLCMVTEHTGYVFALGAPASKLGAMAPTLGKVLTSFAFENKAAAAAPGALHYTAWTDPLQHAFTAEVPAGWKVSGGMYRVGLTDYRRSVLLNSPDGQISILAGDTSLPGFREPGALSQQLHQAEGSKIQLNAGAEGMLLHYYAAPEYNQLYVQKRLNAALDNIQITGVRDNLEYANHVAQISQAAVDRVAPGAMSYDATSAISTFTATNKKTGKPVAGFLLSVTNLATGHGQYQGLPRSWTGEMNVCVYPAESGAPAGDLGLAVLQHLQMTNHVNQTWQDGVNNYAMALQMKQSQEIHDMMMRESQTFMENTIKSGEAFRAHLQAQGEAFRQNMAADEQRRSAFTEKFCDFVLDQQQFYDANGQVVKVPSADYHTQIGGTIVSSNGAPVVSPNVTIPSVMLQPAPYLGH